MALFSNLRYRRGGKCLLGLLALLVAFALVPPVLHAGDWDHLNGRDKAHDPTGAWLITNSGGSFILTVFHEGGTLTGDVQGESAFVPGGQPPSNVINSPESGVWQKTGWKTFAATFLTIEYQSPGQALNQFDKVQFTGVLNESGDRIELTALVTFFDANGNQLPPKEGIHDRASGIRIPLQILPHTSDTLPVPTPPPAP
jgi:hypothetical protein